jgi:hypothetical protein
VSSAGGRPERPKEPDRPRWVGFAFVAFFLIAAFLVMRGCQERDVRIDDQQALATARDAVDFEPDRTSVRFVRQGLRSYPFFAVSLSLGQEGQPGARRATVLVDARSGDVAEINRDY